MESKYKLSCSAYLSEYIKHEIINGKTLYGWYHYIDNPEFHTVGVVATASILILLKKCNIEVSFDCEPMIESLIKMQNVDGGWSYRSNVLKSATEPTARSIQALLLWSEYLNASQKESVQKGIEWLLKYNNKMGLWGPINKKEKRGYIYFSCVALQCLHEIEQSNCSYITPKIRGCVDEILSDAQTSLLACFINNDIQCGWGTTNEQAPTVFHTAYVVYTLLQIDSSYINKHQIIKSMQFLKNLFLTSGLDSINHSYNIGENEMYQHKSLRLTYTHSVDIYVLLSLIHDPSNLEFELINKSCQHHIKCAEKTDWRYREYITCWRLFDVVLLCDFYSNLKGGRIMKHFKVAFTFAGESRNLVENIAEEISKTFSKDEILYDEYHQEDFARPQLDSYLQKLYHDCSDLIVVFLCENYSKKKWCGAEWRSIRDILNNFKYEKIMYIKASDKNIDDIELPGFYASEDGYIDSNKYSPKQIADMIINRYNDLQLD